MLTKEQEDIFLAIINQDLEKLKSFFANNEYKNSNITDNDGNTLLHFASDRLTNKTLPIVQLLLEHGCDPNSVNARFETPLDRAKKNNNIPAMTVMKHFVNLKEQEMRNLLD